MNGIMRDIGKVLNITDEALIDRVMTEMHQHIRFSECTKRQFNREAKIALDVVRYVDSFKGDRDAMIAALAR
jgi:hypothetical protein